MTNSDAGGNGEGWLKKGPWTAAEDAILMEYVRKHGEGHWNAVQRNTGLARCGKSCRLRWANHLRPNLKKGAFSAEEELLILRLHAQLGNKWARISSHLPGRTDNEIKNYWNTRIKRRQRAGLPLYPPDIQRELALKRQRLYHNHPSATTNPLAPLLDHNTTTAHFSTRPFSVLDQSSCFSTAMPTNRNTSLPLLRDHLPFPSNSMHHPQHQLQQMEFNLGLGSYGSNSSLPLPPVSSPSNMELPLTHLSAYPPASGGLLDTLLHEVQVNGGDLQSKGLLPELVSSDQEVRWTHLCGGGGEVDGCNGVTTPRDGVAESAAKWTDSNWQIGEPSFPVHLKEIRTQTPNMSNSSGFTPFKSTGTKMKKEPADNDENAVEEDISQFLNMIQTVNAAAATAPVSECYQGDDDTGAISNEQSSVITEDGIWLEMQQLVSSLSNQTKGQDWRTTRSYTWSNMPGIC